ncbi:hypothetical protein OEZ85_013584 [Tetradesmus obliquus]|uniref:Uncharacterized protein n=1 Tax=Tetradesmus obliquus TaxID=3088 RepID=A0ABY8US57_TETOB|nr:hypothetical protein OEZ85_013584 [Tetradesmus obliquus]
MAKASRAINALRARIQLLLSVEQGTSRQQAVDQQQQQQLAPGGTGWLSMVRKHPLGWESNRKSTGARVAAVVAVLTMLAIAGSPKEE